MTECRLSLGRRQITLKTQLRESGAEECRPGSLPTGPCPSELSVSLRFCLSAHPRKPRPVIKGRGMFVC